MPQPIEVAPGVIVPEAAIVFRAVRAAGPGGQNVNKVASKVELRVDLDRIGGLDAAALGRLRARAASRLDAEGWLVVCSQRTRDQLRNLEDARGKIRELLAQALVLPRMRRKNRPSRAAREARLREKRRAAAKKRTRRSGVEE